VPISEAQLDEPQQIFAPEADEEDGAWASVNVPLTAHQCLVLFRNNIELLFRINPLYEVEECVAKEGDHYRFTGRNLSNDQEIATDLAVTEIEQGIKIEYTDQLKESTLFTVEDIPEGAKITLTESYAPITLEERKARLDEVDKSLVPWARYLQEYLVMWNRWSWCAPWRWYMQKVWASMKPSARRITYMLLWITFAEIIAFLMVFTIFWFEMDEYF
jgi:hypothetical protein